MRPPRMCMYATSKSTVQSAFSDAFSVGKSEMESISPQPFSSPCERHQRPEQGQIEDRREEHCPRVGFGAAEREPDGQRKQREAEYENADAVDLGRETEN